jgi:hypothetical protein
MLPAALTAVKNSDNITDVIIKIVKKTRIMWDKFIF